MIERSHRDSISHLDREMAYRVMTGNLQHLLLQAAMAESGQALAPGGQLAELGRQARVFPPGLRLPLLADAASLIRLARQRLDWPRVRLDSAAMDLLQELALIGPEWEEAWRG